MALHELIDYLPRSDRIWFQAAQANQLQGCWQATRLSGNSFEPIRIEPLAAGLRWLPLAQSKYVMWPVEA
jgi:hypothetical protein